ncbi:MAG: SLBB domain-containing protein [Acidobacteria bacterium]|nr:SLBB domain-containing protein [Acidobacteriota bacterium]
MRSSRFLFSLSLSVSLAGGIVIGQTVDPKSEPSAATVASTQTNERYRIGYQDIISIQVDRHPDLNQTVPVRQNGTIELFRIEKPLVAVCKTELELANDITAAYKEKYLRNPSIRVSVTQQMSQPVMVLGFVEKPQTYYLNRRVHLLELLGMAGGPNKEAGTRMIVARQGSISVCQQPDTRADDANTVSVNEFKVRDVLSGKSTFWIQPGDVVSVLDSDIIYVYGNVNKQGAFKTREPITLTQAIVSAEGLKGAAKKDKIRILRQKDGSTEREEFIVDLGQIEKRKAIDPILQPNDIVAVSEDKAKSILMGFVDSLKGTIPNAIYRIP